MPGLVRLKEATKKPAEKITFWTPLETVTVCSASRANWDNAAHSECKWLVLDKKTPQQLHSGNEQLRAEPLPLKTASAVVRTASQHDHKVGAPRGQDTTTGDQQRQDNECAVERTARQHNHKIGAPRSQAEQRKPLRFARAKSLEQQSVEIERMSNSVNSKSKHKLNSVCGTEKSE